MRPIAEFHLRGFEPSVPLPKFSKLEFSTALSFRPFPNERVNQDEFGLLARAVRESAIITYKYQDQHSNIGMRRGEAYHLASIDHRWYLLARNLEHGKIKTYAVRRISRVSLTGERFRKPQDFDPHPYFASAFRATTGEKMHQVVIQLDRYATTVTAGLIHHPSQQVTSLPDGCSQVRFQLSSLAEIEAWVLGWGPRAEVLQPQEFRDRVRQRALGTLGIYALDGNLQ